MDVQPAEETSVSAVDVFVYAGITGLLTAVALAPAVVGESYLRVLSTLLLVGLLGLVGRVILGSVLTFKTPATPALDRPAAERPPVSVIVPAYNEASVLPATIEACKSLEYPAEKIEVVLCYEADSTDRTADICEAAAAGDERFVAVERDEPGGGKAKAANYALRYASHDIIASIDADHRFEPTAVRRAVAWFESDEDIWCVKGRCYGDNAADSLVALHATVERHISEKADLFARDLLDGFTVFGGGQAFFRRAAFEELGDFDETVLVEDIDMSSRIHTAGQSLRVDPSIVTFEENPPTFSSWWNQRKRWARGWMQVAVRHIRTVPTNGNVPLSTKLDAVYTFAYAILPAFAVVGFPLVALGLVPGVETATYIPYERALWGLVLAAPPLVVALVYASDRREGYDHHPREYLAVVTMWPYLLIQAAVFAVAFVDEFVLGKPSVYVTTARSETPADD